MSQIDYKIDTKLKKANLEELHSYDVDVQTNHIFLFGNPDYVAYQGNDVGEPGVEYTMANRFIKNVNLLMRKNPDSPILVSMKTCGGDWAEGMAIHNMIKACPSPVTILNYTHARSMSSLIFQAANKRVMMPDSYFMFHDGEYAIEGTIKQVESNMEFDAKSKDRMLDIYVTSMKRNGKFKDKSEDWIKRMLKHHMDKKEDVFLTAKEAVEWGLADEIFGETMAYDWGQLTVYTAEQLSR